MRILYHPRKLARVNFGLLYNGYVVNDARNMMPPGSHIPTQTEYQTLFDYLGGNLIAGGKLKESGTTHWAVGNTGTNTSGLGFRGAGHRNPDGTFYDLTTNTRLWTSTPSWIYWQWFALNYLSDGIGWDHWPRAYGLPIRGMKDSTDLSDGETGQIIDNNGFIYPTICRGTQEWMAANLKTTKYRNGDSIPEVTDTSAWAALTTGALCAYDNDWNYV